MFSLAKITQASFRRVKNVKTKFSSFKHFFGSELGTFRGFAHRTCKTRHFYSALRIKIMKNSPPPQEKKTGIAMCTKVMSHKSCHTSLQVRVDPRIERGDYYQQPPLPEKKERESRVHQSHVTQAFHCASNHEQ